MLVRMLRIVELKARLIDRIPEKQLIFPFFSIQNNKRTLASNKNRDPIKGSITTNVNNFQLNYQFWYISLTSFQQKLTITA